MKKQFITSGPDHEVLGSLLYSAVGIESFFLILPSSLYDLNNVESDAKHQNHCHQKQLSSETISLMSSTE